MSGTDFAGIFPPGPPLVSPRPTARGTLVRRGGPHGHPGPPGRSARAPGPAGAGAVAGTAPRAGRWNRWAKGMLRSPSRPPSRRPSAAPGPAPQNGRRQASDRHPAWRTDAVRPRYRKGPFC
ncbi:hypothetical protein GCM10018787_12420 [Streptomyces thermodiastaticus]|nr:hypothetical protein GCM10018787_12420 [Streptomyces thermodiastaticus]